MQQIKYKHLFICAFHFWSNIGAISWIRTPEENRFDDHEFSLEVCYVGEFDYAVIFYLLCLHHIVCAWQFNGISLVSHFRLHRTSI